MSKTVKSNMYKILFSLFFSILAATHLAAAEEITAPNITVELISELNGLTPGTEQYLALRMKPEKDWHVYWKYQGDTGTPPKIKFEAVEGLEFGEIVWPIPERIQVSHLVNYGYSQEVLLLIPVKISKDFLIDDDVTIKAKSNWLVCQEECIPGSAGFSLTLDVKEQSLPSDIAYKFDDARRSLPIALEGLQISAFNRNEQDIVLKLTSDKGISLAKSNVLFIPDSAKQIENAEPQTVSVKENDLEITLKKPKSDTFPAKISGLLISKSGWRENFPQAIEIESALSAPPSVTAPAIPLSDTSVLSALFLAFIGGLILNLMPCVFPILSIKILSFVNKAGSDRAKTLQHGLSFAAGVLVSFWILAGLLISLQSFGCKLGWGFQLQSPIFMTGMIVLLFLVALNLYGFFEFGAKIQNHFGRYNAGGLTGSFLSGVLATLLATPCTAPFMGTAIAVSLSSSRVTAFLIFTFLALGMALPYVVLSSSPRLLKFIPKPGPWMEKFKQFLSLPIFATVIWLSGVYLKQIGFEQTTTLLYALLLIFTAIWMYKNFAGLVRIVALLIAVFAIYIMLPGSNSKNKVEWQAYSNKLLNEFVGQGKPVFVDFTAEWCLTCKLNKFVALDKKEVMQKFKDKGVVMLKADWTSVDPEISEAIKSHGRSGVPLNVLYYGGSNKTPYVFPAVLTSGIVLTELEKIKE